MTKSTNNSVLIVAAEASSALYAQKLLEHWQQHGCTIEAFGVGSKAMVKLGFEAIGHSETMAVMGFQEIFSHWREIKSCFDQLVKAAEERKPKFALLLDYPGFNLRLAKKLKNLGIKVIYYISPQVWAWKTSRVHTIKKIVDKMLVLFPFEKPFYEKYGIDVNFVGHPLLDEIEDKYFSPEYLQSHRQRYGIQNSEFVLGLMPGSRRSELKHHLTTQLAVAEKVVQKNSNVKVALLVAPTFELEEIRRFLPEYKFPLMIVKDDPSEMIHLCNGILCASGTATLQVGLLEKPMVIMYKMNPFTACLAKWFVKSTQHFGLINLVLEKRLVPEYFQEEANVEQLFQSINEIIYNTDQREKMVEGLKQTRLKLGERGATERVAAALQEFLS